VLAEHFERGGEPERAEAMRRSAERRSLAATRELSEDELSAIDDTLAGDATIPDP
jgi:hypothetical protein